MAYLAFCRHGPGQMWTSKGGRPLEMLSNLHPTDCAGTVSLSCKPWQVLALPSSPAAWLAPREAPLHWDSGGAMVGCPQGLGFARLLADMCGTRASGTPAMVLLLSQDPVWAS